MIPTRTDREYYVIDALGIGLDPAHPEKPLSYGVRTLLTTGGHYPWIVVCPTRAAAEEYIERYRRIVW